MSVTAAVPTLEESHVLLIATDDDVAFLRDHMLVEAAFPPGTERPSDPLGDDHVLRYIDGWGRAGDVGLVAWVDGMPVGGAWIRLMAAERPGYGFVDAFTPELTVAMVGAHRGRGVGRALVAGILDLAAVHGHRRVSLSVAEPVNPVAVHLYRSLGFTEVGRDAGGSLTMAAPTAPVAPEADAAGAPVARVATATDGPALARLREVMFLDGVLGGDPGWVTPFVSAWAVGEANGTWRAVVVDDPRGRPVTSALGVRSTSPPAPGRERGLAAHISSVATEESWRRRGCARVALSSLVETLDADGVDWMTLNATPEGAALYSSLGFTPSHHRAMHRRAAAAESDR